MANICELFPCEKLEDGFSCKYCCLNDDFDLGYNEENILVKQKSVDFLEVK